MHLIARSAGAAALGDSRPGSSSACVSGTGWHQEWEHGLPWPGLWELRMHAPRNGDGVGTVRVVALSWVSLGWGQGR